jgi:hypothetical protein
VEHDGKAVPCPVQHALAGHVLALVENGTELQKRVRSAGGGRVRNARGEHSVADPFGNRGSLRPVCADQDLYVDGPVGDEAVGVQHADRGTLPLDGLPA